MCRDGKLYSRRCQLCDGLVDQLAGESLSLVLVTDTESLKLNVVGFLVLVLDAGSNERDGCRSLGLVDGDQTEVVGLNELVNEETVRVRNGNECSL